MYRTKEAFADVPETSAKPLDACLADASEQQAWRIAATRKLMDDLRSGLSRVAPESGAARSGETDSTHLDELFLAGPGRKKSGERRRRILSGLVELLHARREERITTASLARHLELSEAALYRHFSSKSQILESLIGLIEDAVFEQVGQLDSRLRRRAVHAHLHAATLVSMLLRFAEAHPGVSRVMAGDALVLEDEFLRLRMSDFFARFEEALATVLRGHDHIPARAAEQPDEPDVLAAALSDFCVGRLLGFARSGFRSLPSKGLDACLATMLR